MSSLLVRESEASPETLSKRNALLDTVEQTTKSQIQWYETATVDEYRKMRLEGTNGFPKPQIHQAAKDITIPARDGHPIGLHIVPPTGPAPSKGVILHFHAGGFVISTAKSYDGYLSRLADALSMTVASVEYRLAPEHQYPASQLDCLDAALFALSAEGEAQLGGRLRVMGGESAGGYLTTWVAVALRDDHGIDVRSKIDALVPSCGIYDVTYTPSVLNHKREVLLGRDGMKKFMDAAFSEIPFAKRKDAKISPLYADVSNMPPALFLCGTVDPLLDDSVFMATRWQTAGNKTELRLVPAACHAFMILPMGEVQDEGIKEIVDFIVQHSDAQVV